MAFLMFSLERLKFLGSLILSMGVEEAAKGERKRLVRVKQCRKEKFKRRLRNISLMAILKEDMNKHLSTSYFFPNRSQLKKTNLIYKVQPRKFVVVLRYFPIDKLTSHSNPGISFSSTITKFSIQPFIESL